MPANYYEDAAAPAEAPPEKTETKESAGDSQTGILPMSVFPERPKVGDVCDFEVVQVNEDGAVVKYHTMEKEEPQETEAQPTAPPPGASPMAGLMG